MVYIRIIDTPFGDAPEHVRSAWIGLELPLAAGAGPKPKIWSHHSRLTGWRRVVKRLRMALVRELEEQPTVGYAVLAADALAVLRIARPAAAIWWQRNRPHLSINGSHFIFPANCCVCSPTQTAGEP